MDRVDNSALFIVGNQIYFLYINMTSIVKSNDCCLVGRPFRESCAWPVELWLRTETCLWWGVKTAELHCLLMSFVASYFSFSLVWSGIKNGENDNVLVKSPIYLYHRQDLALWLDNMLCQTCETDVNNSQGFCLPSATPSKHLQYLN